MDNHRFKTSNPAQRKGGAAIGRRTGWFERPPRSHTTSLEQRLRAGIVVDPDTGCHIWTGQTSGRRNNKPGRGEIYGIISTGAHRLAWELANSPIADGMQVLHRCDTPRCCNREHLFLGTQLENMADMARKGRARNQHAAKAKAGLVVDPDTGLPCLDREEWKVWQY